jgi:hypothetical protein
MAQAEALRDAGMATINGDEFEIDEKMIGGRYTYPAYGQRFQKRLPTNSLLFFVMRSCTNVQVGCVFGKKSLQFMASAYSVTVSVHILYFGSGVFSEV